MDTLTFALKAWPLIGQSLEDKTTATMSVQEASLPLKPQAKPRPDVAPKPSTQSSSPPLEGNTVSTPDLSTGKVKSIVNKFSLQNSVSNDPEERAANGAAKVKQIRRLKRPPTVKPKPGRARLPLQIGGEQAPPLPIKRSQKPKDGEQVEESNGISAEEGGRSGISDSLWWMHDAAGSSSFWQIAAVGAAVFPLTCRNHVSFSEITQDVSNHVVYWEILITSSMISHSASHTNLHCNYIWSWFRWNVCLHGHVCLDGKKKGVREYLFWQ